MQQAATRESTNQFGGDRPEAVQLTGVILALGGLLSLLWPGLHAPPLAGAMMMIGAGVAWGVYSARGKGTGHPIRFNAGNFLLTLPKTAALNLITVRGASADLMGAGYAVASGQSPPGWDTRFGTRSCRCSVPRPRPPYSSASRS